MERLKIPSVVIFGIFILSVQSLECPYGWTKHENYCYKFNGAQFRTSWKEARGFCEAHYGDLLSITTPQEWQFVNRQLIIWLDGSVRNFVWWTGLRYNENRKLFQWSDDSFYNESLIVWNDGEPNNRGANQDCGRILNGKWSDGDCSDESGYICKRRLGVPVKCDENRGWMSINGACFKLEDIRATWAEAREYCHSQNAELAAPVTPMPEAGLGIYDVEQHILTSIALANHENIWLGVYGKPEGDQTVSYYTTYEWKIDGTALSWMWLPDEPKVNSVNKTCVAMSYTSDVADSNWMTLPCHSERKFVCRKLEGTCPGGWRTFQDRCYLFEAKKKLPWNEAQDYCLSMDANLLTIRDEEQQYFLIDQMRDLRQDGVDGIWLSASDVLKDGEFVWWYKVENITGEVYYKNWYTGQPNNTVGETDCAYINVGTLDATWGATNNCEQSFGVVCTRETFSPFIKHTTTPRVYTCPDNYKLKGASCYMFSEVRKTWYSAKKDCEAEDAQLVKIETQDELDFVSQMESDNAWIGLNDRTLEGQFVWSSDSTTATFTSWAPGKPTNDSQKNCVMTRGTGDLRGQWSDELCDERVRYICEKSATTGDVIGGHTMSPTWSAACGPFWEHVPLNDMCYQINVELLTWKDARSACQHHGGDLLSITSVEEQYYVKGRLTRRTGGTHLWIGAAEFDKGWQWADDAAMAYFNWASGEPDDQYTEGHDCAKMSLTLGKWFDEDCSRRYGFICKKRAAPLTTGAPTTPPPTVKPVTTCAEGSAYECAKFSRGSPRRCSPDCDVQASSYFSPGTCYGPGHEKAGCCYKCYKECTPCPGNLMGCQNGWIGFGDHCYKVETAQVDWEEARYRCLSTGGDLASVDDSNQQHFLISRFPQEVITGSGNKIIWIGLHDFKGENTFTWSDNSRVTYTRWARHEPDNLDTRRCVSMNTDGGWNDQTCELLGQAYVCKAKKGAIMSTTMPPMDKGCPPGTMGYMWSCFRFSDDKKSWKDAEADCASRRGNLATIQDRFTQALISSQVGQRGESIWLGLHQVAGTQYIWSSGHYIKYTMWSFRHTGNEKDKCVAMETDRLAGLWSDYDCGETKQYVCQEPRENYTWPTPATTPSLPPYRCHPSWTEVGDKCYNGFTYYAHKLNWFDARDACRALGGELASFHNKSHEDLVIQKEIGYSYWDRVWIGLSKHGSDRKSYTWTDGSPFDYANWDTDQPDDHNGMEECVEFNEKARRWRDKNCYVAMNYVCQIDLGKAPLSTPKPATTPSPNCRDENKYCGDWARKGECEKNPGYMLLKCKKSCGKCGGAPSCNNEIGWYNHTYFCYYVSPNYGTNSRLTWTQARQWCMDNGGDLASIHSAEQNNFLTSLLGKTLTQLTQWIGLSELSYDGYRWSDGSPLNYRNWAPHEPNKEFGGQKCGALYTYNGGWKDENCGEKMGFMCKRYAGTPRTRTMPATTPMPGFCPQGFKAAGNKCYKVFGKDPDRRRNFTDAIKSCRSMGVRYDLASITSHQEQATVTTLLFAYDFEPYIGFNDMKQHNQFRWVDNSDVSETFWGHGEPNGAYKSGIDCTVLQTKKYRVGSWADVECTEKRAYVCQTFKNLTHAPPVEPNPCRPGYRPFGGSCYFLDINKHDRSVARQFCRDHGGDLVSINNGFEQAFVQQMALEAGSHIWIGLTSKDDGYTFRWSDNWPVTYTMWKKGEPMRDPKSTCVIMMNPDGLWNDTVCDLSLPSVCEINPTTPPPFTTPPPGLCPRDWQPFGANCYWFQDRYRTWADAERVCRYFTNQTGSLVSVHSQADEEFVISMVNSQRYPAAVWVGLSRQPGAAGSGFAWTDGSPVDFIRDFTEKAKTAKMEDKNCFRFQPDGSWSHERCDSTGRSVCKMAKIVPVTTPPPPPCPSVWSYVNGKCYKSYNTYYSEKNWFNARDHCESLGAQLASFHDSETERQVIAKEMRSSYHGVLWLGLSYPNASTAPEWSDGTPYDYTNWETGQPNNHNGAERCVEFNVRSKQWRDKNCAVTQGWVCQIDANMPLWTTTPTPQPVITDSPCGDPKWIAYNNQCYYVAPDYGTEAKLSWQGARNWCMVRGAHLTSIHNMAENNFLVTMLGKKSRQEKMWIGLNKLNHAGWQWADGSPTDMINWSENEPNDVIGGQSCVDLYIFNGHWNDDNCGEKLGYVCQRPLGGHPTRTVPATTISPGFCPLGYTAVGNRCFVVKSSANDKLNWTEAMAACRAAGDKPGFDMASITSLEEQAQVTLLMHGITDDVWIGLSDLDFHHKFLWVDNQPVDVTYWSKGQPDGKSFGASASKQDCAVLLVKDQKAGEWADTDCSSRRGYVCEAVRDVTNVHPSMEPTPVCPEGYRALAEGCYRLDTTPQTWTAARKSCQDHGGELMSIINGYEEALAVLMTLQADVMNPVWIGLSKMKNNKDFRWSDGWPMIFNKWGRHSSSSSTSNQDCAALTISRDRDEWIKTSCTNKYASVCEINHAAPPPYPTDGPGQCPSDQWHSFAGHCYYLDMNRYSSWAEASFTCTYLAYGATLASITSVQEQNYILGLINSLSTYRTSLWIGMHRRADLLNTFVWDDQSPVTFTNWRAANPVTVRYRSDSGENCVQMRLSGEWEDVRCSSSQGYVCKVPKILPSTVSSPSSKPQTTHVAPPEKHSTNNDGVIAGAVLGTIGILALVALVAIVLYKSRSKNHPINLVDNAIYSRSTDSIDLSKHDETSHHSSMTTLHSGLPGGSYSNPVYTGATDIASSLT